MLAAYTETEKQNSGFTLLGANSLLGSNRIERANTVSLLSNPDSTDGFDTCSFYSEASDATIVAFCEGAEGMSIAYSDSESCGSIAYSQGSESCGSIASSSVSTSSCCSYSC